MKPEINHQNSLKACQSYERKGRVPGLPGKSKAFDTFHELKADMRREAKKAFDVLSLKKSPSSKAFHECKTAINEKKRLYAERQKAHIKQRKYSASAFMPDKAEASLLFPGGYICYICFYQLQASRNENDVLCFTAFLIKSASPDNKMGENSSIYPLHA